MKKKISLLGSTGSIGASTLRVVRHLPDSFQITALAAHSNIEKLSEQIREFRPEFVAVYDSDKALQLQRAFPGIEIGVGDDGLKAAAAWGGSDFTMLAMSGTAGLGPALAAIEAGKQIGLANKEILVSAGELVSRRAAEKGVKLLPVDSEHSALFQALKGERKEAVRRLILTASGGPFREKTREEIEKVSLKQALCHPNWKMGPKVTIDSSTMMNKGLEIIEARWLFGIEPERIEVVVHPQSVVHSLVEFVDGSVIAQMSEPDMALPIQYAMTYPERRSGFLPPFDFNRFSQLTFAPPDRQKFICLRLAEEALREGKSYPCFLNGANEMLVERFLRGEIGWIDLGRKLEKLISSHRPENVLTLESILAVHEQAREAAKQV